MASPGVESALDDLRAATCSDGAPSARNLLVTVFGDCVAPHGIGTTVAVADLTRLLAPFGANERLVRTSLSRLTNIGLLAPTSVGRRSFYGVAPTAVERFARADQRIYGPRHPQWDGRWTLVVIDGSEGTADQRARLRQTLDEAGFGSVAPNVLASPVVPADSVAPLAVAVGLANVLVLRGDLPGEGPGVLDESALATRATDLDAVAADYTQFVERFGRYRIDDVGELDGELALKLRLLLIGTYRRIILTEPLLPAALAPEGWIGQRAREVVAELYGACAEASERFVSDVLGFRPRPPTNRFTIT
jgi:phenylacetic acid degradation operon negative regulatory protein